MSWKMGEERSLSLPVLLRHQSHLVAAEKLKVAAVFAPYGKEPVSFAWLYIPFGCCDLEGYQIPLLEIMVAALGTPKLNVPFPKPRAGLR